MDAKRMTRVARLGASIGKKLGAFCGTPFPWKIGVCGCEWVLLTITTFHGICQYSSQYLHKIYTQKLAMGNTCPGSLRSSRPAIEDVAPSHRCKYRIRHRPHDCNSVHIIFTILFPPGSKRLRKQRKANSGNGFQFWNTPVSVCSMF